MSSDYQLRSLARRVSDLEKARLRSKQPRLANSSIEGGALQATDNYGNLTMIMGEQFDGTNTSAVVTGPTPPTPLQPLVSSSAGGLRVYWDGTFTGGAVAPMDFARVTVHAVPSASFPGPDPLDQTSIVGTFVSATGGEITAALDGVEHVVYLVCWTQAGKFGAPSGAEVATPLPVLFSYVTEYAIGSSETVPPTSGWSTTAPPRTPGTFIWTRTIVTDSDGGSSTTSPVLVTGNTGAPGVPGEPGEDGAPTYTWLKYADTPTSGMSDSPTGKVYMGLAMNKPTPTESSSYSDYAWSLIKGADGVPGEDGQDGTTTYTWVKYATSAAGAGMSDDPAGKTYIGFAYNKTTPTESNTPGDYTWSLIQGPPGTDGSNGSNGVSVTSITPYYLLANSGASAPGKPTDNPPTGGWTTTEPPFDPLKALYRTDRVVMSNGTFSYTDVVKSSSYQAALAAYELANGKVSIYPQPDAPWPDGDAGHDADFNDLWINTSMGPGVLYRVVSRTIASNVATVTTETEHDMIVGNLVQIDGIDATFDGTYVVTAVSPTTVSFALTAGNLPPTVTLLGLAQGQDVRPLNLYHIWDSSRVWIPLQDSDATAAATLEREVKDARGEIDALSDTATDAYNTAYAADGRVSISDYEPGPADVTGKNDGSLWITRTRDRRNLCLNPSFESGAPYFWSPAGATQFATIPADGSGAEEYYALRITNSGISTLHGVGNTTNYPITEGQEFIVSGYMRLNFGMAAGYGAALAFYDGSSNLLKVTWGEKVELNTTDWTRAYAADVAPPNSAYVNVSFTSDNAAVNAVWDLDAILIERTLRLGRYFDGESEGGAWTGTRDLSESTLDGNSIIRLFTLEDETWSEKYWTADTIISVSASSIDRGEVSGEYLADNSVPVDKAYMPKMQAATSLLAGDLVHVTNVGGLAMVYKADSDAGRRCNGFVLNTASVGQNVTVYTSGYNPLCTGLVPGVAFLSSVAGKVTNAAPITPGNIAQRVGFAVNSTTLVFDLGIAVSLA